MGQSAHRGAYVAIAALIVFVINVAYVTLGRSATLELRGTGTLPASDLQFAGFPGEDITVSVVLNSDDFTYLQVPNPIIHYFAPTNTIPVEIVGSATGSFANVSPIGRFVALELDDTTNGGDFIGLDVASGPSGTSLLSLSTNGVSGFNGDQTPRSSTELFELFTNAMGEDSLWQRSSSSAVFVGSNQALLFLGDLQWTVINFDSGDFDSDGYVNGRDFLMWQRNPAIGNLADWQAAYGNESLVFESFAIPEPMSLATLTITSVCAAVRRPKGG